MGFTVNFKIFKILYFDFSSAQILNHKTISICNPTKTILDGIASYQQLKVPAEVRRYFHISVL
jgi:hypothetical protein